MMSELDYEKIIGYARQFNQWKQELFPREEYAYRNGLLVLPLRICWPKRQKQGE